MNIYIPSLDRYNDLGISTLAHWPEHLMNRTYLVVTEQEYDRYMRAISKKWHEAGLKTIICPNKGIAATRSWIGLHADEYNVSKFVMIDDDLKFLVRISDKGWQLRNQGHADVMEMIQDIEAYLEKFAHVSVSPREGNNRIGADGMPRDELFVINTRSLRVLGYQTKAFLECKHGRVDVMEDFDVNLQLLEKGHANLVSFWYANGQRQTQMRGGCSTYRTHALHEASAKKLAELHPSIVSLREKTNKGGGEFGTRTEVTIQWKKAYERSFK